MIPPLLPNLAHVKYRRLRRDELEELGTSFTRFLAARGIPADEWARLKIEDEERTNALLDQFSELVFEDVLTRVKLLEQRSATQLLLYRCGAEKIELRGIIVKGTDRVDLRNEFEDPAGMLERLRAGGGKVQLASAERAYRGGDRNADLFELMEKGARIQPDSELFDLLVKLEADA